MSEGDVHVSRSSVESSSTSNVVAGEESPASLMPNASDVFYLRTQDSDVEFLICRDTILNSKVVQSHSIFRRMFDGSMKAPQPIYYNDKIPVYYLAMPSRVLQHVLFWVSIPNQKPSVLRKQLPSTITPELWDSYADYWGVGLPAPPPAKKRKLLSAEDIEVQMKKNRESRKTKLLEEFEMGNSKNPRAPFFRRLGTALMKYIEENHPKMKTLVAGQNSEIYCHFLHTYDASHEGNLTFVLSLPEPEPLEVHLVHCLQEAAKEVRKTTYGQHVGISYYDFGKILEIVCDCRFEVKLTTFDLNRPVKYGYSAEHWPALREYLRPKAHRLLQLRLSLSQFS